MMTNFVVLILGITCLWDGSSAFQSSSSVRRSQRLVIVEDSGDSLYFPVFRTVEDDDAAVEEESNEMTPPATTTVSLPPVIQQIADERAEFHINLGRAMDTLRRDMPYMLSQLPDFSIYDDHISLIDPSGVQLTGLEKYKSAISFLQTFVRFWFRNGNNTAGGGGGGGGLQYRMVYDFCRSSIRISWHAVLIPKIGIRPLRVDGVSYYKLCAKTGKIAEHKIETLVMNNTPVAPPYGILSLLQQDALGLRGLNHPQPQGVPAGVWSSSFGSIAE